MELIHKEHKLTWKAQVGEDRANNYAKLFPVICIDYICITFALITFIYN